MIIRGTSLIGQGILSIEVRNPQYRSAVGIALRNGQSFSVNKLDYLSSPSISDAVARGLLEIVLEDPDVVQEENIGVGPGTTNYVSKFTGTKTIGNSGISDDGAGEYTLSDGTGTILSVGKTAPAFNSTDAAGQDVTIRARDANSSGASDLNGGSIIIRAGSPANGGTEGTVQIPGSGERSTVIGVHANPSAAGDDSIIIGSYACADRFNGIAIGAYTCALGSDEGICAGSNAKVDGAYATAIGPYTEGVGTESTALGVGAVANIANTVNIAGLDIVQKYNAYKWNSLGNNTSRPTLIHADPTNLLSTSTVTLTMPSGCHAWVEEVGLIISNLVLDGGSLAAQPTCSFGITGNNSKHLTATLMTTLGSKFNRQRFTTLATDVAGETSFTMQITIAGSISGGGANKVYKGRPYWVLRVVEDE